MKDTVKFLKTGAHREPTGERAHSLVLDSHVGKNTVGSATAATYVLRNLAGINSKSLSGEVLGLASATGIQSQRMAFSHAIGAKESEGMKLFLRSTQYCEQRNVLARAAVSFGNIP